MYLKIVVVWALIMSGNESLAKTYTQGFAGGGYIRSCAFLIEQTEPGSDRVCAKGARAEWGLDLSWDKVDTSKAKSSDGNSISFNFGNISTGKRGGEVLLAIIAVIIIIYMLYGIWAGVVSLLSDSFKFGFIGGAQILSIDQTMDSEDTMELHSREYGLRTSIYLSKQIWLAMFFQLTRFSSETHSTINQIKTISEKEYGWRYSWGLGFIPPSDSSGLYLYGQIFQDVFDDFRPHDLTQSTHRIDFGQGFYSAAVMIGFVF